MTGTIPPDLAHPCGHRTPPPDGLDVDRLPVDPEYRATQVARPEVAAWLLGELPDTARAEVLAEINRRAQR